MPFFFRSDTLENEGSLTQYGPEGIVKTIIIDRVGRFDRLA